MMGLVLILKTMVLIVQIVMGLKVTVKMVLSVGLQEMPIAKMVGQAQMEMVAPMEMLIDSVVLF